MNFHEKCPMCGSGDFFDFNGRIRAGCAGCHSMERSRLMFAYLERRGRLRPGITVLHFAPDFGIGFRIKSLAKEYVTADYDVELYRNSFPDIHKIDLCSDQLTQFSGRYDLVLHNHVLEHLPCDLTLVLRRMQSCLTPNGEMYFTTPIRAGVVTTEDFDMTMPPNERREKFGQEDHVRLLGGLDVTTKFHEALGGSIQALQSEEYFSDIELEMMRVPKSAGLDGNTVFVVTNP